MLTTHKTIFNGLWLAKPATIIHLKKNKKMSKDKGNKSQKKAPNPDAHKTQSDFQASKKDPSKIETNPISGKKK